MGVIGLEGKWCLQSVRGGGIMRAKECDGDVLSELRKGLRGI